MVPTLMAAAVEPDITQKLLDGHTAGDSEEWPRDRFCAYVDDRTLGAVRFNRFKARFSTQDHLGMEACFKAQTPRKAPLFIDLRTGPFEMAPEEASNYDDWVNRRMGNIIHIG